MAKIKPDTKHPDYKKFRWSWRLVRDCIEGEAAIKRADTTYLPMPTAMQNVSSTPQLGPDTIGTVQGIVNTDKQDYFSQNDPSYHSNPAYMAYKKRAHFPDLSANTQRGLMGLVVRGEPEVDVPAGMEYLFDSATKDGKTLNDVYDELVNNQLTQGRFVMTMDIDPVDKKIKIVTSTASDFINWKSDRTVRNGISMGVFQRDSADGDSDMFSHESEKEFVACRLIDDIYTTQVFDEDNDDPQAAVSPSFMGKTLDYVPIFVVGSTMIGLKPDIIPMYGIANVSVQMYQKSADLSTSEFMSCNPMLTVTGVADGEGPKVVGSTVVFTMENENGKAFYPATDTSALNHVMAHIKELKSEAESYGSNLLNNSAKGEAAETLKIRQFQNGANLLSLVNIAEGAMVEMLTMISEWMGLDSTNISFVANKEFSNVVLSAQEQTALVQSLLSGGMSKLNYLWNMKRAGMLEGTVEDEIERLEQQPPIANVIPAPAKPDENFGKNE